MSFCDNHSVGSLAAVAAATGLCAKLLTGTPANAAVKHRDQGHCTYTLRQWRDAALLFVCAWQNRVGYGKVG